MQKGLQRFTIFLDQLESIMIKAEKQKNPAQYLYQHNARTPLFMLEGLAKLYAGIRNAKKFGKLKEHFKLLEDGIGGIDFYDTAGNNLSVHKKIPAAVTQYLQAKKEEKIQLLNNLLSANKWINSKQNRIQKIRKKLQKTDWLEEERETTAIRIFYQKAIKDLIAFTHSTAIHFDNMEQDVHELRRKLRWLSIYPQALQGTVQLAQNNQRVKWLAKYHTKEIVNSPYNRMPDAVDSAYFLLLDKNYFLSLSWIIDQLGNLKDNGLQIEALKNALQATEGITDAESEKRSYLILGSRQVKLKVLLKNAESICRTFFKEENLPKLIIGIGKRY